MPLLPRPERIATALSVRGAVLPPAQSAVVAPWPAAAVPVSTVVAAASCQLPPSRSFVAVAAVQFPVVACLLRLSVAAVVCLLQRRLLACVPVLIH